MAQYAVRCPFCKTVKQQAPNTSFNCNNCRARLVVGNDGKLKSATPKK